MSMNTINPAIETIMSRTSVRKYDSRPVEPEVIDQLLRAAMAAPSAVNKQPWHFVVVTNPQRLQQLAAANPYAPMVAKAPLAIVVCGDASKTIDGIEGEFWIQDCSAASQNILLAAHALGLGAVWTALHPIADRCAAASKALDLPANLMPLNTLVIGYPAPGTTPKPQDKFKPENITRL